MGNPGVPPPARQKARARAAQAGLELAGSRSAPGAVTKAVAPAAEPAHRDAAQQKVRSGHDPDPARAGRRAAPARRR